MDVIPQIKEIPVNEIQLVDWMAGRSSEDAHTQQFDPLQQSLQGPTIPASGVGLDPNIGEGVGGPQRAPRNLHDVLETSLFSIPLGQLAPIHVLEFPHDIHHTRPYGLIFGLPRLVDAQARDLTTIPAQVVTLDAIEYADPATRFRIILMACFGNTHGPSRREGNYIKALRALKICHNTLHRRASKRSIPTRGNKGRIIDNTKNPASGQSFATAIAEQQGVSLATMKRHLTLANRTGDLTLEYLNRGDINQASALALCKAPPAQQEPTLQTLTQQGFPLTVTNILRAIKTATPPARRNGSLAGNNGSSHPIPDITVFEDASRHAVTLKNSFTWTPEIAIQAIDIIRGAAMALASLCEHVQTYAKQASAAADEHR